METKIFMISRAISEICVFHEKKAELPPMFAVKSETGFRLYFNIWICFHFWASPSTHRSGKAQNLQKKNASSQIEPISILWV